MIVETIAKIAKAGKNTGAHIPIFKSDASKITSKGMGLKRGFMGKQNQFTIGATDAGRVFFYVKDKEYRFDYDL